MAIDWRSMVSLTPSDLVSYSIVQDDDQMGTIARWDLGYWKAVGVERETVAAPRKPVQVESRTLNSSPNLHPSWLRVV